jgi:hypothetical protein
MNSKRILWITQTAIFIALLVSAQAFTRPLGQFVTGSCVNFILVTACVLLGLPSAAVVATVSPIGAFLILGIPVFPIIIPFMMAGNLVLVTVIHFVSGKSFDKLSRKSYIRICAAVVAGAISKFLVLWIGIVQIVLSFIPDIRQPQIDAMSATFSWPQLVTAFIGSSLAIAVIPTLKKALKSTERN